MMFPHCDQRVLHARNECRYCDAHPEWQRLREAWGIAFTGHAPQGTQLPCPADAARPPQTDHDHRRWAGNVATTQEPVNETAASRAFYGTEHMLAAARDRPGFTARLRASMEKHRDLLDRLR